MPDKKSLTTKTKTANEQLVYLLNNIDRAREAIKLFESLKNKKFTTGTVKQDNWLKEILLSFIILKMHTIFDKSKRNVCLEWFLKSKMQDIIKSETDRQKLLKKFEDLKKKHYLIIAQLENNRHEEVVHIPKETKLGVTEEEAVKIRKLGHEIGDKKYINQKSVPAEKMRLSVGNFPLEEAKKLTDSLSKLIFGVRYPRTLDR